MDLDLSELVSASDTISAQINVGFVESATTVDSPTASRNATSVDTRAGSFTTPLINGGTTKVYLPWKPAAVIVWGTAAPEPTDNSAVVGHGSSFGILGQSVNTANYSNVCLASGGSEGATWDQGITSSYIIYMRDSAGTLLLSASATANDDGFTITRSGGSDSAGMVFNYWAIAGCESNVSVGVQTAPTTASQTTYVAFRWRPHVVILPWATNTYQSGESRHGLSFLACSEQNTRWAAEGNRTHSTGNRYGVGIKHGVAGVNPYGVVPGTTQLDTWSAVINANNTLTLTPDSPPAGESTTFIMFGLRYLEAEVVYGSVPTSADTLFDLTGPTPVSPKGALVLTAGILESGGALSAGSKFCLSAVDSAGNSRRLVSNGEYTAAVHARSVVGDGAVAGAVIDSSSGALSDVVNYDSMEISGIRLRTDALTPPGTAYYLVALLVGDPDPSVTTFTESVGDTVTFGDSATGTEYGPPPVGYPSTELLPKGFTLAKTLNETNRTVGYIHGIAYVNPYVYGFGRDVIPSSTIFNCVRINKNAMASYDCLNVPAPSGGGNLVRDYSACTVARGKVYTAGIDPSNNHPIVIEFDPTVADFSSSYAVRADINYVASTSYSIAEVVLADDQYVYFTHRTYLWRIDLDTWVVSSQYDFTPSGSSSSYPFHGGAIDADGIYVAQSITPAIPASLTHIDKSTLVKVRDVQFPTISDDAVVVGDYVVFVPEKTSVYALPWGLNGGLAAYRKTDGQVLLLGSYDAAFDDEVAATPTNWPAVRSYGVFEYKGWLLDLKLDCGFGPTFQRIYIIRADPAVLSAMAPAPATGAGHPWQGFVPPAPGRSKFVRRDVTFPSFPESIGHPNELVYDEDGNFYVFTWSQPAGFLVLDGLIPTFLTPGYEETTTASDALSYGVVGAATVSAAESDGTATAETCSFGIEGNAGVNAAQAESSGTSDALDAAQVQEAELVESTSPSVQQQGGRVVGASLVFSTIASVSQDASKGAIPVGQVVTFSTDASDALAYSVSGAAIIGRDASYSATPTDSSACAIAGLYDRSVSYSTTTSDTLALGVIGATVLNRGVNETLIFFGNGGFFVVGTVGVSYPTPETVAADAVLACTSISGMPASEAAAAGDALGCALVASFGSSESTAASDYLAAQRVVSLTESTTATDSLRGGCVDMAIMFEGGVTATSTFTSRQAQASGVSASTSPSDAYAFTFGASLAESTTATVTQAGRFTEFLAETASPSDSLSAAVRAAVSLAETATCSDALDATQARAASLTESATATTSFTAVDGMALTESASPTDVLSAKEFLPAFTETATPSFSALAARGAGLAETVTTSSTFSTLLFGAKVTEVTSASAPVAATKAQVASLAETGTSFAIFEASARVAAGYAETATPTDVLGSHLGAGMAEAVTASDALAYARAFSASLSESASAGEALDSAAVANQDLLESTPPTDAVDALFGADLAEGASAADALDAANIAAYDLAESTGAHDDWASGFAYAASLAEVATVLDAVDFARVAGLTEAATATDQLDVSGIAQFTSEIIDTEVLDGTENLGAFDAVTGVDIEYSVQGGATTLHSTSVTDALACSGVGQVAEGCSAAASLGFGWSSDGAEGASATDDYGCSLVSGAALSEVVGTVDVGLPGKGLPAGLAEHAHAASVLSATCSTSIVESLAPSDGLSTTEREPLAESAGATDALDVSCVRGTSVRVGAVALDLLDCEAAYTEVLTYSTTARTYLDASVRAPGSLQEVVGPTEAQSAKKMVSVALLESTAPSSGLAA